ncbi:MAG: ABC transporter permease [Chloroflexi bacterium]|nr:ABC transporter permease [Chloroflexota bacterium]
MQIASDAPATFRSSADRPGAMALLVTAVREALSRQRLIRYLVRAEIKKKGTDTVLGNVWWVLDPLVSLSVYVFVFGTVFARNQQDFAVFLIAAMIPFKWFTGTLSDAVSSVTANGSLIKQIQFPKIVLPLVVNGSGLMNLLVGFGVLLGFVIVLYPAHLSTMLLLFPVIAIIQGVMMLGFSFFLAAATVFYRDVGIVIGHLLRLLFYVAPILWSFEAAGGRGSLIRNAVGDEFFTILRYNPVAVLLETFRTITYGVPLPDGGWRHATLADLEWVGLGAVLLMSIAILVLGTIFFKRLEPQFAKVL